MCVTTFGFFTFFGKVWIDELTNFWIMYLELFVARGAQDDCFKKIEISMSLGHKTYWESTNIYMSTEALYDECICLGIFVESV